MFRRLKILFLRHEIYHLKASRRGGSLFVFAGMFLVGCFIPGSLIASIVLVPLTHLLSGLPGLGQLGFAIGIAYSAAAFTWMIVFIFRMESLGRAMDAKGTQNHMEFLNLLECRENTLMRLRND